MCVSATCQPCLCWRKLRRPRVSSPPLSPLPHTHIGWHPTLGFVCLCLVMMLGREACFQFPCVEAHSKKLQYYVIWKYTEKPACFAVTSRTLHVDPPPCPAPPRPLRDVQCTHGFTGWCRKRKDFRYPRSVLGTHTRLLLYQNVPKSMTILIGVLRTVELEQAHFLKAKSLALHYLNSVIHTVTTFAPLLLLGFLSGALVQHFLLVPICGQQRRGIFKPAHFCHRPPRARLPPTRAKRTLPVGTTATSPSQPTPHRTVPPANAHLTARRRSRGCPLVS